MSYWHHSRSPADREQDEPARGDRVQGASGWPKWRSWLRVGAGVLLIAALVILVVDARMTLDVADREAEPSAVQVIQVYAERAFYAVAAVGIAIGVHLASRADAE